MINKFLKEVRGSKSIVIGNSSMDLDSVASSILYAYKCYQKKKLVCPIFLLSKKELMLKKDILFMLSSLNIDLNNLTLKKDIDPKKFKEIILIDHNDNLKLASKIVSIVDHHVDQKVYYPNLVNKMIKKVTSCISLVAHKRVTTKEEAMLIAGTLWVDSFRLHHITKKELMLFDKLKNDFKIKHKFYQKLLALKLDAARLSFEKLINYDFKKITNDLGTSVMPLSLTSFIKKFNSRILRSFMVKNDYKSFIIILNNYTKFRYLVLFEIDPVIFRRIILKKVSSNIYKIAPKYTRKKVVKIFLKRIAKNFIRF